MKKLYALLLAAPLVLAGCTKDSDECNGLDKGCRMSATWSGNKVIFEYEDFKFLIADKSTETVMDEAQLGDEVTFFTDGTYESSYPFDGDCLFCGDDGSWSLSGDQVTFDGDTYTLVALTATELVLRDESFCGRRGRKATGDAMEIECTGTATYYYTLKEDGPTVGF